MNRNTPVWDEHPWTPLPTLQKTLVAEVCVVGLGGSGLTAVLELLAGGARVVGLEAQRVAGGAAGRNGGLLLAGTAMFYHDAVRTLGRARARALYALTLDELGRVIAGATKHVRQVGSLRSAVSPKEAEDCDAQR